MVSVINIVQCISVVKCFLNWTGVMSNTVKCIIEFDIDLHNWICMVWCVISFGLKYVLKWLSLQYWMESKDIPSMVPGIYLINNVRIYSIMINDNITGNSSNPAYHIVCLNQAAYRKAILGQSMFCSLLQIYWYIAWTWVKSSTKNCYGNTFIIFR